MYLLICIGIINGAENNKSKCVTNEDTSVSPNLQEFKEILGSEYPFPDGDSTAFGVKVAAGFYYNLGEMSFVQTVPGNMDYDNYNMGYYTEIKNENTDLSGSVLGNDMFKTSYASKVSMMTLPKMNAVLGRTDLYDKSEILVEQDPTGMFRLLQLENVLPGKNYSSKGQYGTLYYLASPLSSTYGGCCLAVRGSGRVAEGTYNDGGYRQTFWYEEGVRPVVTLEGEIQLSQRADEEGFVYYSIIK